MLRDMWTSSAALVITPESKRELERIVRSGKTEQRIALRARIVLAERVNEFGTLAVGI